ncbi:hypothetical protein [Microbacterium sp. T32]|uniref:hypothetical protein n=1 Tax=Microbacterium sp. T32 TaxID=1776083 RepID=UPI0007ABE720|nr:hypothetical protein [Microbacterium sp. T32]KZE43303.1 hypothetical protein AVW09_00750 [Microbacterium sp. T32]
MIPRYDVDVDPTVPLTASFWVPAPEELEESGGIGDFHDTERIVTNLKEARAVIDAERQAIAYLDANSSTPREFDDLADAIEWETPDIPSDEAPDFFDQEDAWYGLNGLEVGVAGLVYAMNAVGIVTAASCRSHHKGHQPRADYPTVVFAANRPQTDALQPLVESAGCGFEVDDVDRPKLLAVVASSILDMTELASSVLRAASSFAQVEH